MYQLLVIDFLYKEIGFDIFWGLLKSFVFIRGCLILFKLRN